MRGKSDHSHFLRQVRGYIRKSSILSSSIRSDKLREFHVIVQFLFLFFFAVTGSFGDNIWLCSRRDKSKCIGASCDKFSFIHPLESYLDDHLNCSFLYLKKIMAIDQILL